MKTPNQMMETLINHPDPDVALEAIKKERDYLLSLKQVRSSFWKFFFGTFVLGLVAAMTNYQIHITIMKLKEKESQREYVSKFIANALETNVEKRLQFAHYFHRLIGENWDLYYQDIQQQMEEHIKSLSEKEKKLDKVQAEIEVKVNASDPAPIASIAPKIAEAERLQTEVKALQKEISPIQRQIPAMYQEPASSYPKSGGWLYLGKRSEDGLSWIEKTVDADTIPQPGDVLTLTAKTYLRAAKPTKISATSTYILGNRLDVIREGNKIIVHEIWLNAISTTVWANVEVVAEGAL